MTWIGPLARRLFLAVTAALVAAVAVAPPVGAQKSTKDTLSVVGGTHQATLDPHFAITTQDLIFTRNIYNALVKFKPNSIEFEPDLATSWTVSRDGLEYTFKLRRDVEWHKGYGKFTAADVKGSFDRLLDPATKSPFAGSMRMLKEAVVVDDYTVKLVLKEPYAGFLYLLTPYRAGPIVNARAVAEKGANYAWDPIGTGPYVFDSRIPNREAAIRANDKAWGGAPAIKRVIYRTVTDTNAQVIGLENGEYDLIYSQIREQAVADRLKRAGFKETRVHRNLPQVLMMNVTVKPFDNVKVRQAIAHAIDKDNILVVNNNRGIKAGCVFPPQFPTYRPDCDPYPYDVEAAKALMQESGFGSGFSTKLYTDTQDLSKAISESMIADLAEIGITAELVQQDFDVLIGTITTPHTAPLVFIGWFQDFPDSSDFYDPMFSCAANVPGGASFGWYCNEANDALATQARSEQNEATRNQLYQQVEDQLMADIPSVPLFNPDIVVLVTKRTIGTPFHPGYYIDMNEMDSTE